MAIYLVFIKFWNRIRLRTTNITILKGNVSGGNHTLCENPCKPWQKSHLNSPKNHICRWYDDRQPYKISCPNSTSFVRYKNNKFLTNRLDNFLAWNLLFLYLTNEVEFGQDILQGCVSSYHLHMWFLVNLDDFFAVVCTGFHEGCGFHLIRCHSKIVEFWMMAEWLESFAP
jgi:hypothetical protein